MTMTMRQLLEVIGRQTVMIELLQAQLKEAQASEPASNGSGTYHEPAPWAKATKAETPEVR
jgi:hypothetical protein